jgi:hypothetical protein
VSVNASQKQNPSQFRTLKPMAPPISIQATVRLFSHWSKTLGSPLTEAVRILPLDRIRKTEKENNEIESTLYRYGFARYIGLSARFYARQTAPVFKIKRKYASDEFIGPCCNHI